MACKTIDNVHSTLLEKGLIDSKFNIIGNTEDVFPYIDFLNQYGREKYGVKENLISTKTIPARLGKSATVKVFYNQEVGQQIDKIKDNPDLYSSKFNTNENFEKSLNKLNTYLESYLKQFGFNTEQLDDLKQVTGYSIIGATDFLEKIIFVQKENINQAYTKEAAYSIFNLLGKKNLLRKDLIASIHLVDNYENLKSRYVNSKLSDYKIRELIAIDYLQSKLIEAHKEVLPTSNKAVSKDVTAKNKLEYTILKIKKWWSDIIRKFFKSYKKGYIEDVFNQIANDVINNNTRLFNLSKEVSYKKMELTDNQKKINYNLVKLGAINSGSYALNRQGNLTRESVNDLDYFLPYQIKDDFIKNVVKKYPQAIFSEPYSGVMGNRSLTLSLKIDDVKIDFFLPTSQEESDKNKIIIIDGVNYHHWKNIFDAKVRIGSQKHLSDLAGFVPFNKEWSVYNTNWRNPIVLKDDYLNIVGQRHYNFDFIQSKYNNKEYSSDEQVAQSDNIRKYWDKNLKHTALNYFKDNNIDFEKSIQYQDLLSYFNNREDKAVVAYYLTFSENFKKFYGNINSRKGLPSYIINSINGNYSKNSVLLDENNEPVIFYHGAGTLFDKFSKDYFLSGEGAMAYGAGFYSTNYKPTADNYRDTAKSAIDTFNKLLQEQDQQLLDLISKLKIDINENTLIGFMSGSADIEDSKSKTELLNLLGLTETKALYVALTNPLYWQKDISKENKNLIESHFNIKLKNNNSGKIYRELEKTLKISDKELSARLYQIGIDGVINIAGGGQAVGGFSHKKGEKHVIFFEPIQAKAVNNSGLFSLNNENMYDPIEVKENKQSQVTSTKEQKLNNDVINIEITPEERENFLYNSKFSAEEDFLNSGATEEDLYEGLQDNFGNEEIPLGDNYGEFLKYKLEVLSKKEHEISLLRAKLSSATPSFKVKLLKEIKGIEKDINFIQEQVSKLEKYEVEYMFHAIKEDLDQIEQIFKSKDNSNYLEIKKKLEFYDTFLVGKNSEYSAESLQDYVELTDEFNALVVKAKMLSDKYPEYMASTTVEQLQEQELVQEAMENSGKSINELITSTQDITSFDSYLMGLSNTAFSSDNILPQYLQIQMHKALINHTNVSSKLIDILNQVEKETGLYNPDWIYNRDKNGNKDNTIIDSYTDAWFNATKTFRTLIYQYKVSNVKNKHAAHLAVTQWLKDNTFMIDFSKIPKIREIYRNNLKYSKYFDSNFTDEQAETWENEMRKQYGFRYDELIENLILSLERFENISNDTTYSEVYKNRYNVWEVLQNIKNGVKDYHHIKLGDNKISFYSDFYSLPFLPKEANERRQVTNELGQRVPPPDFYNQDFRNTVLNNADNTKYYDAVRNIVKYNNDTYSTNTYTNGRYSFPRVRKEMLQSLGDSLKEIRGGNFKELYSVGKEVLNNWQAMFYEKGFSYETEGKVNSNYRDTYKKEVKEREQGYIIQGLSKEDAYKKAIIETDKNYSEDFSRDIKAISQMASLHNARVEMAPMAESVVEAYKHFNPEMKNGLGRLEYYVNHIIYNRTGKYRNSGKWEGEKINPKIQHFLDIINGVSKGKLAKYKGKLLSDSEKELFSMYKDVIEKGIIPKEISINERIGDSHFKLSKTEKLHTIQGEVATEEEWNKEFEKFIKAKVEDMGLDLNVAGLVDGILKTVIYKALAINPISGIFNRNEGLNSAYIMDATGLYWTPNNLQSAKEMMAFYNSRKIWSKYKKNAPIRKGAKQMSIFEQLIKRMPSVLQDRKDELQRNANENKFSLEDMDIFWLAVQSAESKNQGSIMLSMMMDYKLKDSNGNEVPMIDKHTKEFTAFDLDSKGHIVAKPGFEQYLDNITNFEDLIINMSVAISRSQGNYSQNDIMRAKGAIWGKVLTNMITWLPEHLAQRWGTSKQVDLYRKGEITQGRYVAAAQGNTINTGVMVGLGGLGISYGMLGMAGLIGGGIISAVVATKYLAKIASTNTVKRDANYIKEFTQMLLSLGIEYLNYPSHLLSSIPGMRKLKFFKNANPLSNNTMTEAQQNSMRAMTRELAIMLFWLSVKMAIMALYKGIGGDDDDEKSDRRMRYYFLQNQLSRSITTLESFMNPYAFVKDNAKNTFISELTDIFKLAHSVFTFDWEGIKDNSTAPIPIPSMVDKTVRNLIGNRENSIIQDKIDYSSMVDFEKIPSPLHWTSTLTKDFFTDGEYSNKKEYRDAREKVREKIKEEVMEEYGEDKDLVKTITDLRVKELIGNKYEDLSYEDATESIESGEIMKDPKIKKKSTKQSRLKSLEESLEEQGITPIEVRKIVSKESNR